MKKIIEELVEETVEKEYIAIIPESKESEERNKAILKGIFKTIMKAKLFDKLEEMIE